MAKGPAQFNFEAKEQYQCLDDEQMEELKRKCKEKLSLKVMSSKEIKADGRKIFKKLQNGVSLITLLASKVLISNCMPEILILCICVF